MSNNIGNMPISSLAKRLEDCNGSEFHAILSMMRSPSYVDDSLIKNELSLLVTKIVKLLRSGQNYDNWKGLHTAVVICSYNPIVLCSQGSELLAVMYSTLEQRERYLDPSAITPQEMVVIETAVTSICNIMDLMRGKPALTREGLVPKLKAIIPTFIKLSEFYPKLCLGPIKKLLYNHPTTFKPFANKMKVIINDLISKQYQHFDEKTKNEICSVYAYLHLIKIDSNSEEDDATKAHHKTYHDEVWKLGIISIIKEFKPVFILCGEIIDLTQDKDLFSMITKLPEFQPNEQKSNISLKLNSLNLDFNKPLTLWKIIDRLNLLLDLLKAFITLPTPYAVRIPIGDINTICEILLGLSRNYFPIKQDIRRDQELVFVINELFSQIQFAGICMWDKLFSTFDKHLLTYLPSIIGSVELFIPINVKSNKVNFERCNQMKHEMLVLLNLVTKLISHMAHNSDEVNLFTKLIDTSINFTEIHDLLNNISSDRQKLTNKGNVKNIKSHKKDNKTGALTDIYTHANAFRFENSIEILDIINNFFIIVLKNWRVPSTQQIKISEYAIKFSLLYKKQMPASFKSLLVTIVTNPGSERLSILPIAVNLLKECGNDVMDALCHPRMPTGFVQRVENISLPNEFEEAKDHSIYDNASFALNDDAQFSNSTFTTEDARATVEIASRHIISKTNAEEKEDESMTFKRKTQNEDSENEVTSKRTKIEVSVDITSQPKEVFESQITEEVVSSDSMSAPALNDGKTNNESQYEDDDDDDEDIELEIPEIQLSDEEGESD